MISTFAGSTVRHGTPSGFRLHQKRDETPCDACNRAKQEYDKRWREVPHRTAKNRLNARAQTAALKRLKQMHPGLYAALYAEERARAERESKEGGDQ